MTELLPSRVKNTLARYLTSAPIGRVVGAVLRDDIRNSGLLFDTRAAVVHPSVKASLFFNLYERAEISFIQKYLAGEGCIIDLGASLGITAAHAASLAPYGARMICVEPDTNLTTLIEQNVKRHASHVDLTILRAAISSSSGLSTVVFVQNAISTAGRVATPKEAALATGPSSQYDSVPAISLSRLLDECQVDSYVLICDIEGMEAELLFHDSAALQRCRGAVFELHEAVLDGSRITPDDMVRQLERIGFSVIAQRGPVVYARRPVARGEL